MPVTHAIDAGTWQLPGTTFTALVSPSRGGSTDVAVWRLTLRPGTPPTPHALTTTEVFAVISGHGRVVIGTEEPVTIGPGDAVVVPPDTTFALSAAADGLEAIVCLPTAGQAILPGAAPFTPEWAR
jgi:mannose-6-phosphate isomerase-like protein (cupin superfamily)